mgnify:CR=1 FL=1
MGRKAKKDHFDDEFVRKMEEKSAKLGIDVEIIKGIYENTSNYYVEWKRVGSDFKIDQEVSVIVLGEYRLTGIRPAELARILGVDYNVVHQWIRYGKVDWRKDEGKLWINVGSLIDDGALNKIQKVTFLKWLEKFYILLDNEFRSIAGKRYTEVFDSWK